VAGVIGSSHTCVGLAPLILPATAMDLPSPDKTAALQANWLRPLLGWAGHEVVLARSTISGMPCAHTPTMVPVSEMEVKCVTATAPLIKVEISVIAPVAMFLR
jgi:hypothetical protein